MKELSKFLFILSIISFIAAIITSNEELIWFSLLFSFMPNFINFVSESDNK